MRGQFVRTLGVAMAFLVATAGIASAFDFGAQAPAKGIPAGTPNVPGPHRQGGDTIETALVIASLPFNDTGTTAGYTDDYGESCPYGGGISPDVVYQFTPVATTSVDIDLCGSAYDTKVWVYDADLHLIACNDDFYFGEPCGEYVSKLENVPLNGGATYYIVVDGYWYDFGDYVLEITEYLPCDLDCPPAAVAEGEPPLVPNYVDNWNGGCNTPPAHPFQTIVADDSGERILCGVGGWYVLNGSPFRDTDWYQFTMGPSGSAEITADAQYASYILELGPQDCGSVGVIQSAAVGPCAEATMTISGYAAGETVWFWVGSMVFADPDGGDNEYDYVVWFSGLEPTVATEAATWSSVKALYR